jgi:hypothetical protein
MKAQEGLDGLGRRGMRGALLPIATVALLAACNPRTSQAEEAVKRQLRDPGSAQFRDEMPCERPGVDGVRGEVNARNSRGGYAGFEAFIVINGEVAILGGLNEGASDIETYPTGPERWEALFRRCNSDQTNRSLDNQMQNDLSPGFNATVEAENASRAADAAVNAALANVRRETDHVTDRTPQTPDYDLEDPMTNTAPED